MDVFDTLLTQIALVSVFNIYKLSRFIVGEDFAGTALHKLLLFRNRKLVNFVLIEFNYGLCTHYARRNGAPFSVCFRIALLCDQRKVDNLVFAEFHD